MSFLSAKKSKRIELLLNYAKNICCVLSLELVYQFYCSQEKYNAISGGGGVQPHFADTAKIVILWQLPSRAITYAEKAAYSYTQKDWVFGEKVIETDRDSLISYYIINI